MDGAAAGFQPMELNLRVRIELCCQPGGSAVWSKRRGNHRGVPVQLLCAPALKVAVKVPTTQQSLATDRQADDCCYQTSIQIIRAPRAECFWTQSVPRVSVSMLVLKAHCPGSRNTNVLDPDTQNSLTHHVTHLEVYVARLLCAARAGPEVRERDLQRLGLLHLDRDLLGGVRVERQIRAQLVAGVTLLGQQLRSRNGWG